MAVTLFSKVIKFAQIRTPYFVSQLSSWQGCQQVTNCQPTVGKTFVWNITKAVGRLLANCQPITGQQSANYWPTVDWLLANCWPTDSLQSADSWPTIFFKTVLHFYPKLYYTQKTILNHRTPSLTRVFSNCYKKKQKKKQQVSRPQWHPLEFQIIILAVLVSLQLVSLATQLLFHLYLNHKFSLRDIIPTQV